MRWYETWRQWRLNLELRYPLNGGCKAAFTLKYSVPLQDLVFKAADGSRYLKITFGNPFVAIVVDKLILKVVLPAASDMSMSVPFATKQGEEKRYSYLNIVGRKVVVIGNWNSIKRCSTQFVQVYYRFYSLGILLKRLMLVFAFLAFLAAFLAYSDCDLLKRISACLAWIQRMEMVEKLQQEQTRLKDETEKQQAEPMKLREETNKLSDKITQMVDEKEHSGLSFKQIQDEKRELEAQLTQSKDHSDGYMAESKAFGAGKSRAFERIAALEQEVEECHGLCEDQRLQIGNLEEQIST